MKGMRGMDEGYWNEERDGEVISDDDNEALG